jgi:two-component system response regulator MprA
MPAKNRTVLVVDDDAALRMMVEFVLEGAGYVVQAAADGLEALEQVKAKQPDAILLDMRMPRMDGWEFGRRLRTEHGHSIPLIVMTASERAEQEAKEIDADDFVAKPFDVDNLLRVVARHQRGPS